MRLKTLRYSEREGTNQEWTLEGLELGPRNLIVGRNASGKTRALNVIHGLARQLAGLHPPAQSGSTHAVFSDEDRKLEYELKCKDDEVVLERFTIDGKTLLERGPGGEGQIYAEQIDGGTDIRFQTPPTQLAAVARRDSIQHKYLESLYRWGSEVRMYHFGTMLGKDRFGIFDDKSGREVNDRDPNQVIGVFRKAHDKFGDEFEAAVSKDMGAVGYDIEKIGLAPPISMRLVGGPPGELVALYVKEKHLRGVTDQVSMSQGMFRVLSLFIHVNYCLLAKTSSCILIDDIGEGLDFERSCRMIENLRGKTENSQLQLVLTTNDRFVMNKVPLEEWSVLQRTGSSVRVKNQQNSREIFDEFKFTGLSNFSFFEMDIANDPNASGLNPHA